MKVKELIIILQTLDPEKHIYAALGEDNGTIEIEEVSVSCDDPTVIGYIITDERMSPLVN